MKRLSVIWPLLLLVTSGLWFFQALDALPDAVSDLLQRGAPALLVVVGLMMLFGRRMRFGNLVAILLTVATLAGVVGIAYARQQTVLRNDYFAPFETLVAGATTSVNLRLTVRQTEITINPAVPGDRTIRGDYTGTFESQVLVDYQADGATATFTLTETPRNAIPSLTLVGRGKLALFLPAGVTINELTISSEAGDLSLDSSTNAITTLNVALASGTITAAFADASGLIGDLKTGSGSITVTIPPALVSRVALRGGGAGAPQFDQGRFTLDINRVLVSRTGEQPQVQLNLDAPGLLTVR
jgi:hypothetical protein